MWSTPHRTKLKSVVKKTRLLQHLTCPYSCRSYLACPHRLFSILTTRAGMTGLATPPPCMHVSDESREWKRIVQSGPPTAQAIHETLDFAEQLSWSRLGVKLLRIVEDSAVVEIS